MRRLTCIAALLALAAPVHAAEAAKFTKGPTARREGKAVRIEFAVSAPVDATVWVEDGAGKVVRRIGSAKLGAKKVPAPFKPGALAQSIVWDGKDEKGKPAPAGCRVKVALGMKARFVEMLGQDDQDLAGIHGIGVRPGSGELYVLAEGPGDGKHTVNLSVLDREGKYVRTLIPAPNTLTWEKAEKLGAFKLADGSWIPRLFHPTGRCFTPLSGRPGIGNGSGTQPDNQGLAVTKSGTVYRVNRVWTRYHLAMHAADGGAPGSTTIGTWLPKKVIAPEMALSPDEKYLYIVGLGADNDRWKWKPGHAVWRTSLSPVGEPKPFIGDPVKSGGGDKLLNDPRGVAVDATGRVYVCDYGNNRIVRFDKSGKKVDELNVEKPVGLAVNPKSGALYVIENLPRKGRRKRVKLARYDDLKSRKPATELVIDCYLGGPPIVAVDFGAKRPIVWLASSNKYGRFRLLRIEDLGGKFGDAREMDANRGAGNMPSLGVDAETDDLFSRVSWYRWLVFEGGTGKPARLDTAPDRKGSVMDVGPDGSRWWLGRNLRGTKMPLVRTGRDNRKHLPLSGGKEGLPLDSDHLNSRGFCVGPDGSVYAVQYTGNGIVLKGFNPGGSPKGKDGVLVAGFTLVACSPKVDSKGRVYVADSHRPAGAIVPEVFKDNKVQLAKSGDVHNAGQDFYPVTYGSIMRFGPKGGRLEDLTEGKTAGKDPVVLVPRSYRYKGPGARVSGYPQKFARVAARGCDLVLPGISPVTINTGHRIYCRCGHAQFDIDGFDRLVVPDATRFQVRVYDSEGNLLHAFGGYGNADCRGPKSAHPKPEIPLAWGELVVTSHKYIYVGDNLNRRIVKVRLDYAETRSCPAP